jgi:hypothetical protein
MTFIEVARNATAHRMTAAGGSIQYAAAPRAAGAVKGQADGIETWFSESK